MHKYFDLKNKEFMGPYDLPPVEYALDDNPWVNDSCKRVFTSLKIISKKSL